MSEWWTYRLSSFLLFSPRTYHRLFELYNAEVWPLHLATLGLGVAIWFAVVRRSGQAPRVACVVLGAAWLWIAWAFHWQRYASINWAATWFAAAFAVQGMLLLGAAAGARRIALRQHGAARGCGLAMLAWALALHPLLGAALGRPWSQAQVFGLAPDPTVLGTLGVLLALRVAHPPPGAPYPRRAPSLRSWLWLWRMLWAVPLLWCLLSAATLWPMHQPDALLLPMAATLALIAARVDTQGHRDSWFPLETLMSKSLLAGIAALIIGGVAAFFWWQQRVPAPAADVPPATAQAGRVETPEAAPSQPAALPAIRYPVETSASAPAAQPPTAGDPDAALRAALSDLIGRDALLRFVLTDDFARRVVATVDNLARHHAAPALWPVQPTPGRFAVETGASGTTLSAANFARYAPFVDLVDSLDVQRTVALYRRLYPILQQAYEDIGFPGRYFNDRLVDVIDHLLATPRMPTPAAVRLTEVKGPIVLQRPWLHYEWSDPSLEALSAGHKMLLRVGPAHAERLERKLAALRRELVRITPR